MKGRGGEREQVARAGVCSSVARESGRVVRSPRPPHLCAGALPRQGRALSGSAPPPARPAAAGSTASKPLPPTAQWHQPRRRASGRWGVVQDAIRAGSDAGSTAATPQPSASPLALRREPASTTIAAGPSLLSQPDSTGCAFQPHPPERPLRPLRRPASSQSASFHPSTRTCRKSTRRSTTPSPPVSPSWSACGA